MPFIWEGEFRRKLYEAYFQHSKRWKPKPGFHAFFKIRNPIRNPELELNPNPRSGAPKNRIFEKLRKELTLVSCLLDRIAVIKLSRSFQFRLNKRIKLLIIPSIGKKGELRAVWMKLVPLTTWWLSNQITFQNTWLDQNRSRWTMMTIGLTDYHKNKSPRRGSPLPIKVKWQN